MALKTIPITENPLIIRTDFSDDAVWKKIVSALQQPDDSLFLFNMELLEDPQYTDATADMLVTSVPKDYQHPFIAIADSDTMLGPEHPLLMIDLADEPGNQFRAIPASVAAIENNLSIANMGFDEFAQEVDDDEIFRGI